jgi:hypothetical protein
MKTIMGISANMDSYAVSVYRQSDNLQLIESPLSFWTTFGKILFWNTNEKKDFLVIIEDCGRGRINDFLDLMDFYGIGYVRVKDLQSQLIDLEKDERHV